MTSIEQAIDRMKGDLDRVFAGKVLPEKAQELRTRLDGLRKEMQVTPGVTVNPVGKLSLYTQLRELLQLFKEVMLPVLLDLEKQRLDVVLKMAQAQGGV